jgi:preprotein translocase subunit SecG
MLTYFVVALCVTSAAVLILLVLLHSGRGGGLSDMFGGGLNSTAAGSTVVERNLNRITIVVALVFVFTAVALGIRLQ